VGGNAGLDRDELTTRSGQTASGVRATHTVLQNRLLQNRDCVNGLTNNCGTAGAGLVLDTTDVRNHGTSVADIIGGNNNLGNNFRGVTGQWLQSFKVGANSVSIDAVGRAIPAAVAMGNAVLNLSLSCNQDRSCADRADAAFDAGSVVVAAITNDGWGAIPVPTPGEAKKALAVGAVNSMNERWASSSGGPAPDGRTKPDLMGFGVFIETAGNASDTGTRVASAVSFATPFVAGATALMRRWLQMTISGTESGHTMAMMIASGDNTSNSAYSNMGIGAGTVILPTNATLTVAKASSDKMSTMTSRLPSQPVEQGSKPPSGGLKPAASTTTSISLSSMPPMACLWDRRRGPSAFGRKCQRQSRLAPL
jgi:hypothetical protein